MIQSLNIDENNVITVAVIHDFHFIVNDVIGADNELQGCRVLHLIVLHRSITAHPNNASASVDYILPFGALLTIRIASYHSLAEGNVFVKKSCAKSHG